MPADPRPLVLHVVFRFGIGGLENGIVNLINRMAPDRWRHGVLALTAIDAGFARRIRRDDVVFEALDKPPGHLMKLFPRVHSLLRRLDPAVVHTRNFGTLEAQVPAWTARVPARVHGEHGWDVNDPGGTRRRYQLLRRLYVPFVHQYVTVSSDLQRYLVERVGVPPARVEHLCNGVDAERFAPATAGRTPIPGCPFTDPGLVLVGTVGRMQAVKDPSNLARAFVHAVTTDAGARARMRLVFAGGGPQRAEVEAILDAGGVRPLAWLAGERDDVPDILRGLDVFVLPSLAEGISNTILEAMSTGLPVLATAVGGNVELVEPGVTGTLVPAADSAQLGAALLAYLADPALARRHGHDGRQRVEQRFSLAVMVARYERMYARLLGRAQPGDLPREALR